MLFDLKRVLKVLLNTLWPLLMIKKWTSFPTGLSVMYFKSLSTNNSILQSVRAMWRLRVYWCSFLPPHLLVTAKSASQQRAMRSPLFVRLGRREGRWSFSRWTVFCPSGARGHAVTPVRKREWVCWCPTGDGWSGGPTAQWQRTVCFNRLRCSDICLQISKNKLVFWSSLCEFSSRQNMKLSI